MKQRELLNLSVVGKTEDACGETLGKKKLLPMKQKMMGFTVCNMELDGAGRLNIK